MSDAADPSTPSPAASPPIRPLYPLFLKLEGEPCLVVGGGALAGQKVQDLLTSGAVVTVVSTEAGELMQGLADDGLVNLHLRPFEPGDVGRSRVVIAATDDQEVNRRVAAAGRAARALVNVVDVIPLCDFYTGGVVRRGPLTVVIGTNGASPSLARRTRLHLEKILPDGLGRLGTALGAVRPQLLDRYPSFKERAKILDRFVTAQFEKIMAGDEVEDADQRVEGGLLGP